MIFGSKQGDHRVQKLLEKLDLKYSVDQDGDFKVVVEFEDGRSQAAFINSDTETLGGFEIREIWSVAYISEGYLDIDTANTLLLANDKLKIGAWRLIAAGKNRYLAAFCVQISADTDPQSFLDALLVVLRIADEMEEKLTGEDDL